MKTRKFADTVKNYTNYFVITAREPLYMLLCSYNKIYQLEAKQPQNGGKYYTALQVYSTEYINLQYSKCLGCELSIRS